MWIKELINLRMLGTWEATDFDLLFLSFFFEEYFEMTQEWFRMDLEVTLDRKQSPGVMVGPEIVFFSSRTSPYRKTNLFDPKLSKC